MYCESSNLIIFLKWEFNMREFIRQLPRNYVTNTYKRIIAWNLKTKMWLFQISSVYHNRWRSISTDKTAISSSWHLNIPPNVCHQTSSLFPQQYYYAISKTFCSRNSSRRKTALRIKVILFCIINYLKQSTKTTTN